MKNGHRMFKRYLVTVTPKILSYAGNCTQGEYTVTIGARTNAEAIKYARRDRRDNEGRYAVPCTYRARLEILDEAPQSTIGELCGEF